MKRRSFLTAALGLLTAPLSLFRKKPEGKWEVRWFRSAGGPMNSLHQACWEPPEGNIPLIRGCNRSGATAPALLDALRGIEEET